MEFEINTSNGTDDTALIQEAIDDAGATAGHVTVQLGFTPFAISKLNLRNRPGVHLRGKGRMSNGTTLLPIESGVNMIEWVDTWGNEISDFTIGDYNAPGGAQPNTALFFGMGPNASTNIINIRRVFIADQFLWGPFWNQGAYRVTAYDSEFWNYWSAYTIGATGLPELPSFFGALSQDLHPVNGGSFINCEAHAIGDINQLGQTLYGNNAVYRWFGGCIMARYRYGTTWVRDNWPGIGTAHISPEGVAGDSPVWV